MYVERLLQLNIATLACLATVLIGMGQQSAVLPLAMFVLTIASVWLNDFTRRISFGRGVTGVAQVAALLLSLASFRLDRDVLILSLARLLVFWQIVVLYQKKDVRTYWHQLQLSLLQVVVAALLAQDFLFGLLLIVYLFTALCAVTLIFLYEERNRYQRADRAAPILVVAGSRWPLGRQQPSFSGVLAGRPGVQRELFTRMLKTAGASLMLSVLVFLLVPRFGHSAWRGPGGGPRPAIGFDDRVRLGSLVSGSILQNPQKVLEIRFFREAPEPEDPNPVYLVRNDIYLRGALLTQYNRGEWKRPRPRLPRMDHPVFRQLPGGREQVRQEITTEPLPRNELFCVWPFTIPPETQGYVNYDPSSGRLTRAHPSPFHPTTYRLWTTAFDLGWQSRMTPHDDQVEPNRAELLAMPPPDSPNGLPGLAEMAQEWLTEAEIPHSDTYRRALILEGRLRDSGLFEYSLAPVQRDLSLDPVEDFTVNHRQGHCEYFATALAMMLRSARIPARIIVGFHTDEWHDRGNFFLARQLHAHTWVEAYLEADQVPEDLRKELHGYQWSSGAWLRLDPTPASRSPGGVLGALTTTSWLNWLDNIWSRYVIHMDRGQQQTAVYRPATEAVKGAAQRVADLGWWRGLFKQLRQWLGLNRWLGISEDWVDGLLAAALSVLLVAVGYGGGRLFWNVWAARLQTQGGPERQRPRSMVAFYRRLEAILARRGLVRGASQTQREFAARAGQALPQSVHSLRLAKLPGEIVEAFYRVRFGGQPLDKQGAEAVEQALAQLDGAISRKG